MIGNINLCDCSSSPQNIFAKALLTVMRRCVRTDLGRGYISLEEIAGMQKKQLRSVSYVHVEKTKY